jgi:basic membrane lipoprotein Med (substrate-binding protein (PBP1-ABC) superfamily)
MVYHPWSVNYQRESRIKSMHIRKICLIFGILIAAALAACSQAVTPAPSTPTAGATIPAATPTEEPYVLLVAPENPPTMAAQLAVQAVEGFASEKGLKPRRVLPGDAILASGPLGNPALVAAIASGNGAELTAAAQAHADVKFVAIEEPGVQPLANLLVVGGDNVRHDQVSFMAGLLATIENRNDYVGWVGEADTVRGKIYQNGFRHGIRYICPRCRVFDFELSASADAAAGISAAGQLGENFIDTASAIPGAAGDAALIHLAENGVRVAGTESDFYRLVFADGAANGAKSVLGEPAFRPDLLLKDLLARYLAGESFAQPVAYSLENGGLEFAPFPNDWISFARQAFLRNILAEVAAGRLDIGIDPQTGEER